MATMPIAFTTPMDTNPIEFRMLIATRPTAFQNLVATRPTVLAPTATVSIVYHLNQDGFLVSVILRIDSLQCCSP